jgi:excinuclease ABC subunit B
MYVFPASHYVAGPERMNRAVSQIEDELAVRLKELEGQNKLLEAQRLRMRTTYDLEMMQQMGFCNGIENYSRHIDGRGQGTAPHCLIDYFPDDFLLVIDESHVTVPQIGATLRDGQPAAQMGRVPGPDRPDGVPVRDTGEI